MSTALIRPVNYILSSLGISCVLPIFLFMQQTAHERVELLNSIVSVPLSPNDIEPLLFFVYYSSFMFILRNYAISVNSYQHLLFLWSYWVSLLDLILLYRKFVLDMMEFPMVDNMTLTLFVTMFLLANINLRYPNAERGNEILAIGSYVFYWFV